MMTDEWANKGATERARRGGLQRGGIRGLQNHPATSEIDYTQDDVEFANAMQAYIRQSGHKFPSCKETLQVFRSLGYRKVGLMA